MKRGPSSIFFMIASTAIVSSASAWAFTYVVKDKDVLSLIAKKYLPGPVWGAKGSVAKIVAQNPHLKNPNIIHVGDEIKIPSGDLTEPLAHAPAPSSIRDPAQVESSEKKLEETTDTIRLTEDEKKSFFKRGAVFVVEPSYMLSVLSVKDSSTGTPSSLATKYYVGADLKYVQEWSGKTKTYVLLNLAALSFEKPTDSSKTIQDAEKFISGVGLGASFDLSNCLNLQTETRYQKQLFARPVSTQVVTVDAVNVLSVGARFSYDLLTLDPFVMGVSSSAGLFLPSKTDAYDVRVGARYSAIIYLKQKVGDGEYSTFQTELGFSSRIQNTSLTTQNQTDLMLGLRFNFPVGRRQKNLGQGGGR